MGFIGLAIISNLVTWAFTWRADVDTRKLRREREVAAKNNQTILEDVVVS